MHSYPLGSTPSSAISSRTKTWDMIADLPPHKIFLWDKQGQYLDYSFPNPLFGHGGDPTRLKEATVLEVFPTYLGQRILENIESTLASQTPGVLTIDLPERNGQPFKALIRFFPLATHVLGLVNDLPQLDIPTIHERSPFTAPFQKQHKFDSKHPLTYREQQIMQLVGQDYSNETIAHELYISQRTVKYHLLNIYKKLGVASRTNLQAVASCLLLDQSDIPLPSQTATSVA